MKKLILLLLASALVLLLTACGGKEAVPESLEITPDAGQVLYTHDNAGTIDLTVLAVYSDGSKVDVTEKALKKADLSQPGEATIKVTCTVDGTILSGNAKISVKASPFVWESVPDEYTGEAFQKGSVERFTYLSYIYTTEGERIGEAQETEAYVYLPYGYDETQEYDVLYLMHGGSENAGYWLCQGDYVSGGSKDMSGENFTVSFLDNCIQKGYCQPLIVVTPCINTGDGEDKTEGRTGLNGVSEFQYEFKNELVPAIETKYATYANGDVSAENLIATREHRAYAGLSMGSMTGFSSILMGCTDYVAYIGNYSGCWSDVDAISASLTGDFADYPILYWYNGEGTRDMAHDEHIENYRKMLSLTGDKFTEGVDFTSQNAIMVDKEGHAHNYQNWIVDLYNTLGCFFRK